MKHRIWLVLTALAAGCSNGKGPAQVPRADRNAPGAYVVSAKEGDWIVTVQLEPWDGKTAADSVAAYGFIDSYDPMEQPGHNPVPVSFVVEHRGKPVRISPAMYTDLFYLDKLKVTPSSEGSVIDFEGSDAGGHYAGMMLLDENGVYKRVVWDALDTSSRMVTTWGYHKGDVYDREHDRAMNEAAIEAGG